MDPLKARFAIVSASLIFANSSPCENLSRHADVDFFSYTLPDGDTPREIFTRNLACYVFDGILGHHRPDCTTSKHGILDISTLPESAVEGLLESVDLDTRTVNITGLRSWWNTWSYPLREHRSQLNVVPDDLATFERLNHFKNWPREVITLSHVKNKTRVIYRSPDSAISVSQTLNSQTGDVSSEVVETELAVGRNDHSGNFDFYAYNASGQLSTTAKFPIGERTVPGVCMSCHYSQSSRRFERSGK